MQNGRNLLLIPWRVGENSLWQMMTETAENWSKSRILALLRPKSAKFRKITRFRQIFAFLNTLK